MDVLKLYWKALILGARLGWWLLGGLGALFGWIQRSKSQTPPELQQTASQSPAPAAPPAPAQQPVQVVIHNMPPQAPAPVPPVLSAAARQAAHSPPTVARVLHLADHGIYITDRSSFVLPHPDAERLLERLDYILFHAAHRDGNPYSIPPALDDSGLTALPLAMPRVDTGFDDVSPHILGPDGGLWVACLGHRPELLDTVPLPLTMPSTPITKDEESDSEETFDHPDFDPVSARHIPTSDDRVWVARLGHSIMNLEEAFQ